MSNNMYVYTTSQKDVLYISYDGDLRLIAQPDQTALIEMGMEAAGVDIVHIEGSNATLEEGIDVSTITDEVGDQLSKRIIEFVDADEG